MKKSKTVVIGAMSTEELPEGAKLLGYVWVTIDDEKQQTVVALNAEQPIVFPEGKRFTYSNNVDFAAWEGKRFTGAGKATGEIHDSGKARFVRAINAPPRKVFQPTYESLLEKSKNSAIGPK